MGTQLNMKVGGETIHLPWCLIISPNDPSRLPPQLRLNPGEVTVAIQSAFFEAIQGKRDEYLEWLDFVELDAAEPLKEPVRISRAARQ